MSFRVLVADDERLERRALLRILSGIDGFDIDILEAANGRQAVELAAAGTVDLAFLDIRMPGMDGLEAAHELKALWPAMRVVFVTAFDHFDYAREAIRLGVDEYLVKPASADEVRATAVRMLTASRDAAARRAPATSDSGGALALLEDELRSDLHRDDLDGSRLASFFRLKGTGDGDVLVMAMRIDCALAGIAVKKDQARRAREFGERFLASAGWRVLAEARGSELRCAAFVPRGDNPESSNGAGGAESEAGLAAAADIKRTLDRLAADLLSGLTLRMLVGACAATGEDGSRPFQTAKDALALARPDRPVALLSGAPGDAPGGRAGAVRVDSGFGGFGGSATVERAIAYMRGHLAEGLSLADVAQAVGSAPSHLSRLFGRHGGDTFVHALCRLRIDAAKSLMRTGQYRVKEVCAMVGFNDQAYFSRVFRKYEGASPADFLAGGD